jgi:hypothetical protein
MLNMRSVILAVVLFAGSFLGVRWIALGAPIPGLYVLRVVPLEPNTKIEGFVERSRKDIAATREREWLESKTAQGDDDPERAKLRESVIEAATAFTLSPCNDALKKKYIEAAIAYARAFVVLGGCPNFPICRPDNDALMENAKKVFGSPAGARAREAMRGVHEMGIGIKDYPGRLGLAIDHLSGSSARGNEEFSCTAVKAAAPTRTEDHRPSDQPLPPPRREQAGFNRQDIDRETRERSRNAALELLRRPGPGLCADPGRRNFVAGLDQYYSMRDTSQHGYAKAYRSHEEQVAIERAWSTALDQQIDGLVREFYAEGYLRPKDLRKTATVDQVLSGLKWTGRACVSVSASKG